MRRRELVQQLLHSRRHPGARWWRAPWLPPQRAYGAGGRGALRAPAAARGELVQQLLHSRRHPGARWWRAPWLPLQRAYGAGGRGALRAPAAARRGGRSSFSSSSTVGVAEQENRRGTSPVVEHSPPRPRDAPGSRGPVGPLATAYTTPACGGWKPHFRGIGALLTHALKTYALQLGTALLNSSPHTSRPAVGHCSSPALQLGAAL
jgi:hypothetical protein